MIRCLPGMRAVYRRPCGRGLPPAGPQRTIRGTFDGPARAISCGAEVVERVRELGIEIRVGVHTGECEVIDGKCAGLTVSIGARVASNAEPSEVLVSRTVKDLVAGSGLAFEDRGEHELKGVPDRWHLYRVVDRLADAQSQPDGLGGETGDR